MFDFLFNPLARAQRRLKQVEKLILQEETIFSQPTRKLAAVAVYNKHIGKSLNKVRKLMLKEAQKYNSPSKKIQRKIGYDACVKNYHICLNISIKLDQSFKLFADIETEMSNERSALEEIGESDFTNKWLKDLKWKYDKLFLTVQHIEQEVTQFEEKKSKPALSVPRNLAESYVRQRIFFTREADLERIALECGYTIIEGGKHKLVKSGINTVTAIPRHREIARGTAEKIMKEMAKGG